MAVGAASAAIKRQTVGAASAAIKRQTVGAASAAISARMFGSKEPPTSNRPKISLNYRRPDSLPLQEEVVLVRHQAAR
jgi:hypothetical protein